MGRGVLGGRMLSGKWGKMALGKGRVSWGWGVVKVVEGVSR